MKIIPEAKIYSAMGVKQAVFSALAYFIPLIIFKHLIPNTAQLEYLFCFVILYMCGLLFGLPSALGIGVTFALACFWLQGNFLLSALVGCLYFLVAYSPYKLWYAFKTQKEWMYFDKRKALLKFVAITCFCAWHYAVLIAAYERLSFGTCNLKDVLVEMSTVMVMPLWLGLPLGMLWNKYSELMFYPPAETPKVWQKYTKQALVLLVALEIYFLLQVATGTESAQLSLFTLAGGIALWGYGIQLPSKYQDFSNDDYDLSSLPGRMMQQLLLSSAGLVAVYFLGSIYLDGSYKLLLQASYYANSLMVNLMICVLLIVVAIYVFMGFVEKQLTEPVLTLCRHLQGYLSMHTEQAAPEMITLLEQKQDNELSVLARSLDKMGKDIANYTEVLDKTMALQQSFTAQMAVATSIQQGVLPNLEVLQSQLQNYHIYGDMHAAKSVGGDLYDAFLVDEDHLFVCVADVAGKGVPAALFMMIAQTLLKENAKAMPANVALASMNASLAHHNEQCLFLTLWLVVVELSTGKCTYVNAGHNPPLLKHKDGKQATWLEPISGPVVGLMEDVNYTNYTFTLEPGASLLLYTDGLNEAENQDLAFFGNERLEASFLAAAGPEDVITSIRTFTDGAVQSDDMTYVWLERKEVAACN